jgi:hypothetical protein
MTPIDQLALEAAKALNEKYCIDGHDAATPPDQELADLLAPFLRRAAESKWHDIATAPKDGENVLLWDGVRTSLAWFSAASDEWLDGTDFVLPTHWMPLPDAPR